jgi:hypothetical protein
MLMPYRQKGGGDFIAIDINALRAKEIMKFLLLLFLLF